MSNWREQFSEESETQAMVAWLEKYYHIPVLVVLVGFILWNRLRNYGNFIVDGTVYLSGNDPWYHMRMTDYTVQNFPATMPFDPWTNFPYGTTPNQFGTMFDQIIALAALIVGLGNPSESLVHQVFLVSPAFFAVLICIPGYFIGKRLGGRVGGLIIVATVAFVPDRLMSVTLAGNVQHHSMEVLFMSLSILAVMVALSAAEREKPVYELIQVREFGAMRETIGYSMIAGVALAMYVWAWPPAMWIFGILGIFFLIYMSIEHIRGRSPEHTAFVGVISMTTAGILILSTTRTLELTGVTSRSLIQPGLAFAGAGGVLFLAWLSREFDTRSVTRYGYPATIAGSIVLIMGVMALALPNVFDFLINNINRVFGFVTTPGTAAGTIGEARPMSFDEISETYYLGLFTAAAGGGAVMVKQLLGRNPRAEELLIVIWAVTMLIASLTQVRFSYYLTITVGALNAVLIGYIFRLAGSSDKQFGFETYQLLTVGVIVLVMFAPFFGLPIISADTTPTEFSDGASFPGDVVAWDDSLQYMNDSTPVPGQFGHPDNEPMDLYGTYEETDDFDYPDGAYGVMSWWDYGHWITERGERIPNANPFQQGATEAAEFLLAQDEDEAIEKLEALDDHEEAQTRFVMIDWLMVETESNVGGKFFAPPEFHGDFDQRDFTLHYMTAGEQGQLIPEARLQKQPYYDSMVTRLYHYHGSSQNPQPVVVEWTGDEQEFPGEDLEGSGYVEKPPDGQDSVLVFDTLEEAQEYVDETPSAQIGGLGAMPTEQVEALEHFRLVHMSETSALPQTQEDIAMAQEHGVNLNMQAPAQQNTWNTGFGEALMERMNGDVADQEAQQMADNEALNMMYPNTPAFTKTFEKVPGATVEGTGPEDELIEVTVLLEPENGNPFTYDRQVMTDEDGSFELVLPYATTGYDEYGVEEGYTEPAVEADGEYIFTTLQPEQTEDGEMFTWEATANVTEAQVIGEDPEPVTVDMEREEFDPQEEFDFEEGIEIGEEDEEDEEGETGSVGDQADTSTDQTDADTDQTGSVGDSTNVVESSARAVVG